MHKLNRYLYFLKGFFFVYISICTFTQSSVRTFPTSGNTGGQNATQRSPAQVVMMAAILKQSTRWLFSKGENKTQKGWVTLVCLFAWRWYVCACGKSVGAKMRQLAQLSQAAGKPMLTFQTTVIYPKYIQYNLEKKSLWWLKFKVLLINKFGGVEMAHHFAWRHCAIYTLFDIDIRPSSNYKHHRSTF